ncbi:MAG: hypothetical protein KAG34_06770 [Cocleimonas sp.]|nr:hypothetical protein [Cocleimonas sp.]
MNIYILIISLLLGTSSLLANADILNTTTENIKSSDIEAISTVINKPKKVKKNKPKNHGLSGQFSYKGALGSSSKSISASVKWKPDPKDYYYAKTSIARDLSKHPKDDFTYGWGIGYDDWHEGTWTVQVNHWGGIVPEKGLDTYSAAASLGYKVKSEFLKKNKLKSGITIAKQLGGDSDFKMSASLGWSPAQYWTIKGILVKPLNGDDPVWNYIIGYDDWHPNTFGFEYSNYNSNSLYETTFKKNGKLAITYKWSW